MSLSLIAAVGRNGELGKENKLPWYLPEDLLFFRKITTNNTIIMGRKTFESLPKMLPKRRHVVLTKSEMECPEDIIVYHDINELLKNEKNGFVIGGASIYSRFIDYVLEMYLTEIDKEYEADTYFPTFDKNKFDCEILDSCYDENEAVNYKHVLYKRKRSYF